MYRLYLLEPVSRPARLGKEPIMEKILNGINPETIDTEYRSRNIDTLTDHELFVQVAEIISEPRDNPSSFELHALERNL